MDNNVEEFKRLKNQAHSKYVSIGSVYSPVLRSSIFFNSNGWHHLRYDSNRSERKRIIQLNKFRFFQDAVSTIKKSTTIQEYRRVSVENYEKESVIEWFAFWSIISFTRQIRIKVIVRRVGGFDGQYHFWSVMPFWSLRHRERAICSVNLSDE